MKSIRGVIITMLILFAFGSSAFAQDLVLKGRSVLEIDLGMWGGSKVSNTIGLTGIQASADVSSFVGTAVYSYGLREEMAVTLSVGMMSAGANIGVGLLGVSQETGTVVPILIGMRYFVPSPETGAKIRPFLSLGVGTFIGMAQSGSVGLTVVQEAHTESAFGGRIGAGVDFYIGNQFKFVVNVGYNLMTNFSVPVTGRDNFNGGDFSLGAGIVF